MVDTAILEPEEPEFQNPFIPHSPVRDPKTFINRTASLRHIRSNISNSNRGGVIVIGESGLGKTSLLNYVYGEEEQKPDTLCIHLKNQHTLPLQEEQIWYNILSEIGEWLPDLKKETNDLKAQFKRSSRSNFNSKIRIFFRKLERKNKVIVVLLDQFDWFWKSANTSIQSYNSFYGTIYDLLESSRNFSLVTTISDDLSKYDNKPDFFKNMFPVYLSPFEEKDCHDLFDRYLANKQVKFLPEDRTNIIQTSSGIPRRVQQEAWDLFDKQFGSGSVLKFRLELAPEPKPEFDKPKFDVFIAHSSQDKPGVKIIVTKLKQHKLKPWLDTEQIPPGRQIQKEIQQAILTVKSAAIFIGPNGIGKWEELELRAFISKCIEREIPVIPVLLPGVDDIPEDLPFLREFNWVKFKTINDTEALNRLVWGITGEKPRENS